MQNSYFNYFLLKNNNCIVIFWVFDMLLFLVDGGPDPKLNHKLGIMLEQAKKNNVPMSVVENALKSGSVRYVLFL